MAKGSNFERHFYLLKLILISPIREEAGSTNSMKFSDSIVHFTVQQMSISKESYEIKHFTPEYGIRYRRVKKRLKKNLVLYHSCMRRVLELWHREFGLIRQVDYKELGLYGKSYDLLTFDNKFTKMVENTRDTLCKNWLPKVLQIFIMGKKKGILPCDNDEPKITRFWNCLAFIMESQLRSLCLTSIEDYMHYLTEMSYRNCSFNLNVTIRSGTIGFDPSFKVFTDTLISLLTLLHHAVSGFSRIEINVYDSHFPSQKVLQPMRLKEILESYKQDITEFIQEHRIGPELQLQNFDDHVTLINETDYKNVELFLNANPSHSFEEYAELIEKYDSLRRNIPVEYDRTFFSGLFDVDRKDFMDYIASAANYLKEELVNRMIFDYQNKSKKIGEEYQHIADRALSIPPNTTELMKLTEFVKKAETERVLGLESRLKEIIKYVLLLSNYTLLSPVELKTNNFAFQWYHRMQSIFDEHRKIVARKTDEYREALVENIEKFQRDLTIWEKHGNEMQYWGNIDEIFRYQKKATSLEKRLIDAIQTIEKFNEEEQMFGQEMSQYPLRKKVADKLVAYKKFYDAACEFLIEHDMWMKSLIGTHDPEVIETNSGTAYRTVLKIEKSFQEPSVRKLAETVRMQIEEFREHISLIMTLGNPGMKNRHWNQVSEIVGFPIKVDDHMTLAKIIDFGLDEYVAKFEGISEAATKESNLEKALLKMHTDWTEIEFTVNAYRDTGTYVIASVDEIQLLLDDHLTKAQTMKNSLYIKPFENETLEWEGKLHLLQEIMDHWLKVQATWMYLEPIFSSPDIQQQMPEEGRRFSAVDKVCPPLFYTYYIRR